MVAPNRCEHRSVAPVQMVNCHTVQFHLRHCRSVKINPERLGLEERFLPPGTMRDLWEQMVASENDNKASFAQFWRIWKAEYPHMKFRATSSHAMCSVCLRHKLLIKEMGHHLRARTAQRDLYNIHLRKQYQDRCVYWRMRAASRLGSPDIVLIVDSMDQAKFMYPRGDVFRSKELSAFQRPRAHITGVIAHGYFTLFSVSAQDLPKDSSTMIELVGHCLTLLRNQGVDLRCAAVTVQCDNTPREMKNNPFVKFLAYCVSTGILMRATLSSLRTGHSHEDIDQLFGQLAKYLVSRCRFAGSISDFVSVISNFMDTAMKRPHERGRYCVQLDQTRNW